MAIPHALAYGTGVLLGGIYPGNPAADLYRDIQKNFGGDWLDDKYDAIADWYNPQPEIMSTGPLSRNSRANAPRRQYDGRTNEYFMTIPGTNVQRVWSAEPTGEIQTTEVADEVVPLMGDNPHFFESQNNPHGAWSPDYIAKEKENYKDWIEATNGYQKQKEHMRRIDTGLGTLYPGEAADRYYEALANDIIDENNASRDRHREGMASGAYKAWSNQIGRGLIDGRMIGEDMNTHGRIHPVLKADWDSEMAGRREAPDFQPWKADNRSDWQKWKDYASGGY